MAKDKKNKSSDGAESVNQFVAPSEKPADSDNWKLAVPENMGDLFIVTALTEGKTETKFGEKTYIEADVIAVDEDDPEDSELHSKQWIFGGYLQGSLREYLGQNKPVLARLNQGTDSSKGNVPWIFDKVEDEKSIKAANAAYRAINNPF